MATTKKICKIDKYACELHILLCDNAKSAINRIYRYHKCNDKYKDEIEGMMLTLSMDRYYFIIDNRYITNNTILHELYHLTQAMTADRNIFEEESRAWTQGYLGDVIYSFLKEKNINL